MAGRTGVAALLALASLPFLASFAEARPRRLSTSLLRASPRKIASRDNGEDPCGTLFEENDVSVFSSNDVQACTSIVPFNSTVGSQFLQYFKDSVAFQSTLPYLATPPPSYQQPAVDVLAGIELIQRAIDSNVFSNEYDFEIAVLRLIHQTHEGHLDFSIGATAPFTFGSAYAISSISSDGVEPPKPYLTDDVLQLGSGASPISEINGVDAVTWLTQFASDYSSGNIDPNADWNLLFQTPAGDIQNFPTTFTGDSPFYPGGELNFKLENGTTVATDWLALIDAPFNIPIINNATDFFSFFVLGITPDEDDDDSGSSETTAAASATLAAATSAAATSAAATSAAATTDAAAASATEGGSSPSAPSGPEPTNWYQAAGVTAYPNNPFISEPDLGGEGFLTGYMLDGMAVLSIPTFEVSGVAARNFSLVVGEFLLHSKNAGVPKILIDLQQNFGGASLLAVDTFKQFFPSIDPFGGSRMRDSSFSNALGNSFTGFAVANEGHLNRSDQDALTDVPWQVLDFLDADTDQSFTSWPQFFGPRPDHGDSFSNVQRDNLSDTLFDKIATGGYNEDTFVPQGIVVFGFGNRTTHNPQPYAAEDIIILTDGVCASACSLFVEMMSHEAGVRTVVVGGRPNIGPMQAVAGTRGALEYSVSNLDDDIFAVTQLNSTAQSELPASHLDEPDLWIQSGSVNLRDQIREGEFFPLQFAYEAADCRIYWTFKNVNNFAQLWQDAAGAVWSNSSKCVQDSTVFADCNTTDSKGPSQEQLESWGGYGSPTPASLLPPNANLASPAPVAQWPDGQPYVPGASVSRRGSDGGAVVGDLAASLEQDTTFIRSSTLNQRCEHLKCDVRNNEVCTAAAVCRNGVFETQRLCKKKCTQSSQCGGGTLVCNQFDVECAIKSRSSETCNYLLDKQIFVGSGTRKTTVGGVTRKGHFQSQEQGFCDSLVRENSRCENAIENNIGTPTNVPVPVGGVAAPGATVVVDVPVSQSDQTEDNNSPIVDSDDAAPHASIGDTVMAMFGL